jgi:hypothetical protein
MCDAALLSSLCCLLTCYYAAVSSDMGAKCSCFCSCGRGRQTAPSIQVMEPPPPVERPKRAWVVIEAVDGTPMVGIVSPSQETEEAA